MDTNAFTAGIRPGGLTSDFEVRVLVCYLLSVVGKPVSFLQLSDMIQADGYVNYFEFAESISELLNSGHIQVQTLHNEEAYTLTKLGEGLAENFLKTIPLTVREKTAATAERILTEKKLRMENRVEIQKVPDGYTATLFVTDVGTDLMRLQVFLPTQQHCEALRKKFLENPVKIYREILTILTD